MGSTTLGRALVGTRYIICNLYNLEVNMWFKRDPQYDLFTPYDQKKEVPARVWFWVNTFCAIFIILTIVMMALGADF